MCRAQVLTTESKYSLIYKTPCRAFSYAWNADVRGVVRGRASVAVQEPRARNKVSSAVVRATSSGQRAQSLVEIMSYALKGPPNPPQPPTPNPARIIDRG